jgi:hypothetical protein
MSGALLILFLLYLKDFFFDVSCKTEHVASLFTGCTAVLSIQLSALISMILLLISGMLIYKISFDHLCITGREHLLVWLWIITVGGFSFLHPLSEVHLATIFILLSYDTLFTVYKKTSGYKAIFISSMYLGIATFCYSYAIYLFIPYIISLYRFKIAGLRDWIISIAGFLVPFYFSIFVFYFSGRNWLYPIESTLNSIVPDKLFIKIADMNTIQYVFCTLILILVAAGMLMPTSLIQRGINQKTKSCMRSFSTLMFFSIMIFLLFAPESKLMLQVILIPATVYLRNLFVKINKDIIANSLFSLLILASAVALIFWN